MRSNNRGLSRKVVVKEVRSAVMDERNRTDHLTRHDQGSGHNGSRMRCFRYGETTGFQMVQVQGAAAAHCVDCRGTFARLQVKSFEVSGHEPIGLTANQLVGR